MWLKIKVYTYTLTTGLSKSIETALRLTDGGRERIFLRIKSFVTIFVPSHTNKLQY